MTVAPEPSFRVARATSDGGDVLSLSGRFAFADAKAIWAALHEQLSGKKAAPVAHIDLSGVEAIDGGVMAMLVQLNWDQARGPKDAVSDFVGASEQVQGLLKLYDASGAPPKVEPEVPIGFFGRIGNSTLDVLKEAQLFLSFLGTFVVATFGAIRHPTSVNWRDLPPIMSRSGADAVPIVVLITFLIGFVMAFQSAVQLKQFGANIYVADLVALSITRELGPLMTAIILCGRSGAAFAAELGTMKVSEEIDALRTLGIGPLRHLVFPRILALLFVLPVLTLLGDLMGILGGLVVGIINLDLTFTAYINQTGRALDLWDVFQGLIKAGFFGLAIGMISCANGLATTGGAEGVGRRTTSSVVTGLFALILIDAAFTLTFHELGL